MPKQAYTVKVNDCDLDENRKLIDKQNILQMDKDCRNFQKSFIQDMEKLKAMVDHKNSSKATIMTDKSNNNNIINSIEYNSNMNLKILNPMYVYTTQLENSKILETNASFIDMNDIRKDLKLLIETCNLFIEQAAILLENKRKSNQTKFNKNIY